MARPELSSEEFVQLQEDLLFLKMQNHELREENARTRHALAGQSTLAPQAAEAVAQAALQAKEVGRSLANVSVAWAAGAGAQLGARAAQLTSTLNMAPDSAAAMEYESLRSEVTSLRQRLRAAAEELSSARSAAMAAQRSAADAAAVPAPEIAAPEVEALRLDILAQEAREGRSDPEQEAGAVDCTASLPFVTDEALLCVARAVIQLAAAKATKAASATSEEEESSEDGDSFTALLVQVQQQQKELMRLHEAVDRQQDQIARLADKAATEKRPQNASLPSLEEKLRTAESRLGDLGRRLESSEGASRQTYELRCHLQSVLDRVRHRDQAIEQLLSRQERLEVLRTLRREQLALAQEDLLAHWREGQERKQVPEQSDAEGFGLEDSDPAKQGLEEVDSDCDATRRAIGVQAALEEQETSEDASEAEASEPRTLSATAQLIEELRAETEAVKQRSAAEVQDLRSQIRKHQQRHQQAVVTQAPATAQKEELQDVESSGLLYVQKIEELEGQNLGLDHDLELLASSEQCLLADSKEKEDLIAYLLRSMRSDHTDTESDADAVQSSRRGGLGSSAGGMLMGLLRRGNRSSKQKEELDELGRTAEESLMDNLRLRKDLKTLAEEYRKASLIRHPEEVAPTKKAAPVRDKPIPGG